MHYDNKWWIVLSLFSLFFIASTCEEAAEPGPSSEDFTKEKREQLGDLLHQTILQLPNEFPLLDRATKGDSVIQLYLETLYNQATQGIRADRTSRIDDRWNPARPWLVTVLDDNTRYAFSVPGGYFYISSGFLRSMSKGYEIYYLMAFEAANVEGRFLIDDLISEYSPARLLSIVDHPNDFSFSVLEEVTKYLKKEQKYEETVVQEIDARTAELICTTSIFDRFGILSLLEILSSREQWRNTRPSYGNRLAYLSGLKIEDCGNIKETGTYKKMILDNL